MNKEEAYRIFIEEIANGDEKLKTLAHKNVMMPLAFNSAWAMSSKNQAVATKHEIINKVCEYLREHIDKGLVIYHQENWKSRDEFIEKFRKEMEEE